MVKVRLLNGVVPLLVSCLLQGSMQASARDFRAADTQAEDYPTVQALVFMDQLVATKTEGRHRIRVFHSRQLGEEKETIEQTRVGAIDLNRTNVAPIGGLVPEANVLALPFLFRSMDHLYKVLDGPIGAAVLASFEAYGFVGLTFYDSGARSIYNSVRPVRSLKDLTGLTTRLIDGAENNWPSYVTTNHFTAARHYTMTEHTMSPEVLVMSRKAWDSLSAEDQTIFRAAAQESGRSMRQQWKTWEESAREQARKV